MSNESKKKEKNLFLECFISNEQIIFQRNESNEKKRKQTNAIQKFDVLQNYLMDSLH